MIASRVFVVQEQGRSAVAAHSLRWPGSMAFRLALTPCAFVCFFAISQLASRAGYSVSICLTKRLVGIPCPGCGVTTSVSGLIDGRIEAAIAANAAGPVVLTYFALQIALTIAAEFGALADQSLLRISRFNGQTLSAGLLVAWLIRMSDI
jgi:uncharacterized protein DUF2752